MLHQPGNEAGKAHRHRRWEGLHGYVRAQGMPLVPVMALCAAILCVYSVGACADEAGAYALKVIGEVTARVGAEKKIQLRPGDAIPVGATVAAGENAAIRLVLPGGQLKTVLAGKEYRVPPPARSTRQPSARVDLFALARKGLGRRKSRLIDTSVVTTVRGPGDHLRIELVQPLGAGVRADGIEWRWAAVPGAAEYALTLWDNKTGKVFRYRTRAPEFIPASGRSPIQPGRTYAWQVSVEKPVKGTSDKAVFTVVRPDVEQGVERKLAAVRAALANDVDPEVMALLEGTVYEEQDLLGDALSSYDKGMQLAPESLLLGGRALEVAARVGQDRCRRLADALVHRLGGKRWRRSDTVVVVPFSDQHGGTLGLGMRMADAMTRSIAGTTSARPVSQRELSRVLAERGLAFADIVVEPNRNWMTAKLGATHLVVGRTRTGDSTVDISVQLLHAGTGDVQATADAALAPGGEDKELESLLTYVQRPPSLKKGSLPPLSLSYAMFAQRQRPDGAWEEVVVSGDPPELKSNDQFKLHFTPSSDCYVYLLLFDSQGNLSCLFPHKQIERGNFCRGGLEVQVPDGGNWYWLDSHVGTETFYLTASYEPIRRLDKLMADMAAAGGEASAKRAERVRGELERLSDPAQREEDDGLPAGFRVRGVGGITAGAVTSTTLSGGEQTHALAKVARSRCGFVRTIVIRHR